MASPRSMSAQQVLSKAPEEFRGAVEFAAAAGLVLRRQARVVTRRDGGKSITLRWHEPGGTLSQTVTLRLPAVR